MSHGHHKSIIPHPEIVIEFTAEMVAHAFKMLRANGIPARLWLTESERNRVEEQMAGNCAWTRAEHRGSTFDKGIAVSPIFIHWENAADDAMPIVKILRANGLPATWGGDKAQSIVVNPFQDDDADGELAAYKAGKV